MSTGAFGYVNLLKSAADASWTREEVLTNNIANVDTPNYKRQDVEFSSYLANALQRSGKNSASLTQRVNNVNYNDLAIRTYTDNSTLSYRTDGNNVDLSTENVELASEQINYNALIDSMNNVIDIWKENRTMSMFTAFNISASGMTAQQLRTDVISENIANADTTRTSDGTPYVRKAVVFTEKTMTGTALGKSAYGSYGTGAYSTFSDALRLANGGVVGSGVKVTSVYEDTSTDMERVYDPSHPDADENGYVTYPNVNVVQEMTDLIDASRSYEANISAFNASKSMASKGLSIGSAT